MRKLYIVIAGISLLVVLFVLWSVFHEEKGSEEELFILAQKYQSEGKNKESVEVLEKIVEEFPKGENRSIAVFMLGFIYANNLKEYDKAEKYYKMFIEEYSDHEFIDDAKFELDNLGKDIDSLLFERIKKQEVKEKKEVIKK